MPQVQVQEIQVSDLEEKESGIRSCLLLGDERIPTVSEAPVKSFGRWYTSDLRDTKRVAEVKNQLEEGLSAIDKCGLPGKCKLWCLQFGLLPRLMWPLMIYEVAMTHVEAMERRISVMCQKWLGVPKSFSTVALYGSSNKLSLPLKALTEDFKVGKARLHLAMRDSSDSVVSSTLLS